MSMNVMGAGRKTLAEKSLGITLASGAVYQIPSGQWFLNLGPYTFLEWFDPVTYTWRPVGSDYNAMPTIISSDGSNYRLSNLTGTVMGAVITNAGTGYTNGVYFPAAYPIFGNPNAAVQAGTAAAPSVTFAAGGGTILAQGNVVVGGAISTTITITTAGSLYTRAPTIVIDPPAPGGVQATAVCTISGGVINAVTVTNQGAGYAAAPSITIVNGQDDTTGANAVLTATLTGSGTVTAITMANRGAGYTSVPAITFSAASTTAATAIMCFTCTTATAASPSNAGNGNFALLASTLTAGSSILTNPAIGTGIYTPRLGRTAYSTTATPTTTTILDGGLHQVVPGAVLVNNSNGTISAATTWTIAQGGVSDTSYLIPL